MTVVICFIAVQIIMFFFLYPLLVAGKWEDEQMQRLFEEKRAAEGRKELEDKMESQRDVLRMIEKEISKGSVPVRFAGMGFTGHLSSGGKQGEDEPAFRLLFPHRRICSTGR